MPNKTYNILFGNKGLKKYRKNLEIAVDFACGRANQLLRNFIFMYVYYPYGSKFESRTTVSSFSSIK